jgi:putative acetyltransferase
MTHPWLIRDETVADVAATAEVTAESFRDLAVSHQTEPSIIAALRTAGVLAVSLVAEIDRRVVGHIAFSPVTISDGSPDWYGLGPISVIPECQRRGIGGALIREGLSRLRARKARGCCLVGHPGYDGRFGFVNPPDLGLDGVPREVFFALAFEGPIPRGRVTFHESFQAAAPPDDAGHGAR